MGANREQQLQASERRKQALQLRLAGASYDEIASRLGYSDRGSAWRSVMAALKATLQEPADELRKLELERLDRLLLGVWGQAAKGNQGAVDRALRIMERRAKLLGLDAPTKVQQENVGDTVIRMTWGDETASDRRTTPEPAPGPDGGSDQ